MGFTPYNVRYRILSDLLNSNTALAYDNAFTVDGESSTCLAEDDKAASLDTMLLRSWNGDVSCLDCDSEYHIQLCQRVDRLALNVLERNRLKHDDFDVLGCLGEGQFGVVSVPGLQSTYSEIRTGRSCEIQDERTSLCYEDY